MIDFIPCNDVSKWPTCEEDPREFSNQLNESKEVANLNLLTNKIQQANITFTPINPGKVVCYAKNEIGISSKSGAVKIGELNAPFTVSGFPKNHKIAEGDSVIIECVAITYNCLDDLLWTKDGKVIEEVNGTRFENETFDYSFRKKISWTHINKNDEGTYRCEAYGCGDINYKSYETEPVSIKVYESKAPKITSICNQTTMLHSMGDMLIVNCTVTGLPVPILIWYKNDEIFEVKQMNHSNRQDIIMSPDNSSITFNYLSVEDSGKYICVANSRIGVDKKEFELIVEGNYFNFSMQQR